MIKKIVDKLLRHRHFWRDVGFDELSELYVSSMLRTMAVSLLMVFVPFFLYQHGYSFSTIFICYGSFFATRIWSDFMAGYLVARFGPKHTMIISCILQIISAALFLSVPSQQWPTWLLGIPWGMSASCYFVSYHVDFSKIKHTKHSGKELGYMQMMEKTGAIMGPLIGGLVGTVFGSQYIFLVAVLVLIGSLWPLLQSSEPVRTHQTLDFKGFPVHQVTADLRAYVGLGVENTMCINLWPLFAAIFALGAGVYAKLGLLTSLAILVSVLTAYFIGHHIDTHNARRLLRAGTIINAILHLFRPLAGSLLAVLGVNVANEIVTTTYRMPFLKGMYAAADDLPGHRIVYIVSMEAFASIAKGAVWFILAILATVLTPFTVLTIGFMIAAIASLMINNERFSALDPRI